MSKSPNRFVPSGKLKALELREGSGIPVSNANSGRFRYNEALNRLEYSENSGAWAIFSASKAQTITVAKSGGDFTSVKAAVDYVTSLGDASITKPYLVQVYPGDYTEDPFTISSYVTVKGQGELYDVVIRTTSNAAHFVNMSAASELAHMAIVGPTGAMQAAVNYEGTGYVPAIMHYVEIRSGYYGVWCHPAAFGTIHCLHVVNHYSGVAIEAFLRASGSGFLVGMNCAVTSGPANAVVHGYCACGANATLSIDACTFSNTGNTDAVFADDGALVRMKSCSFVEGLNAIHIGITGVNTTIYAAGVMIGEGFTYDVLIDTPLSEMAFNGVAEQSKFSIPPNTAFSASFVDVESAEPGNVTIGELWLGHTPANSFPLGSYSYSTAATGLASGGEVTEGAGLVIHVHAGVSYIRTITGVTRVTWADVDVPVSANLDRGWVIVDHTGGPVESLFRPDPEQVTSLCSYATDGASVVGISRYYNDLQQIPPKIAVYDRDVIGPICVSGCTTTQHADPSLELAVAGGTFYVYFTRQTIIGANPIVFTYWHRVPLPGTGWVKLIGQNAIDPAHYDHDGALDHIPGGEYKRDLLYVTSDGVNEEYHVVYGQETFVAPPPGGSLTNPTPPDFLNQAALRLSAIVVLAGAADVTALVDQRPFLGQYAAPTTGVTIHGMLLGLAADDHVQYQLRAEENVALGYCGLNAASQVAAAQLPLTAIPPINCSSDVAVVGASDEIARANHRHQIDVAAPVAIGTANAIGAGPQLSMADHVHAHGVQSVDTLHALAVAGVSNGFFSSADKTKLDGITASATSTTTVQSDVATTTASAANVLMTGMTITPGAGTYLVIFSGDVWHNLNAAGIYTNIYAAGVLQAGTERHYTRPTALTESSFCCTCKVTVLAGQAIEGRWRTTAATANNEHRMLVVMRVQ
jgi:hypothetical protein